MSNGELSRIERLGFVAQTISASGFGSFHTNEQISEWSGYKLGTLEFSFFVSSVRQQLVKEGMWLSGEGQEGKGFFVIRPSENSIVASRNKNAARKVLSSMKTLLEQTPLTDLTEAEQRRHDKELREIRYSNRLMERQKDVLEVVKKHMPGILNEDIEVNGQ